MNFEERVIESHKLEDLTNRCFMCRKPLDDDNRSDEDVNPKWLMRRYHLWDQSIVIPNGSTMPYRMFKVPCCKKCNNEKMSAMENAIKKGVEGGFQEFIKLDRDLVAWWVAKLYYAKVLKELTLKIDRTNPDSETITKVETFDAHYGNVHMLMNELLQGTKFEGDKPYELYIYKSDLYPKFDYLDNVDTDVVYIKMDEIVILCSFFPTKSSSEKFAEEVGLLENLDLVSIYQVLELYTKMIFYKSYHVGTFATAYDVHLDVGKVEFKQLSDTKIGEYDFNYLRLNLILCLKSRRFPDYIPLYEEEKEISLILYGACDTMKEVEIY